MKCVESADSGRPVSNYNLEQSEVLLAAGLGFCSRGHVCYCEESESSMLSCTIEYLESGYSVDKSNLNFIA